VLPYPLTAEARPGHTESTTHTIALALKEFGWVDGQNVVFDRRFAESDGEARTIATDMVRLKPDVIVT